MWLVHKNKECTLVRNWKTSYMDTNIIHIKTYPNWLISSPYYNKNTISIQLVVAHTIHQTQGLTLDYLAFNPTSVYKHGLTYKYFLVKNKKNLFLFQLLYMIFLKLIQALPHKCIVYKQPHVGMYSSPNDIHFATYMYLFIISILSDLPLHIDDILLDYNLKPSHILCFIETHFNANTSQILHLWH